MRVKIFFVTLFSLAMALSFISCEGEQGPAGPAGAAGADGVAGPAGPAGADGKNGAENCVDCHGNNQLITAKMFQLDNSLHHTGGTHVRNFSSCATCHTSQGFLHRVETGMTSVSETIGDALPINCYTCHMVHNTYTADDWELTTSNPVTFWVGEETVDLGASNLCISCHQARVPSPALPMPGETGTFNVTNKRYGPHHGSQGVMFTGNSAYEVAGDTPYEDSQHTTLIGDKCINCHMASVAGGNDAGGHTFRVSNVEGDINQAGCVTCHSDSDALTMKIDETQTEIGNLLNALGTKLNSLGILDDELTYANVPIDLTAVQLGVLWNYKYVLEDNSLGVHNYKYAKALLENSIAALD